jgi:NitT/TauT family transport system ATP-binding protein
MTAQPKSASPVRLGVSASTDHAAVELRGTTVAFKSGDTVTHALDSVDLTVPPGQFVALVGPSGCGKTTILNLLAGLMPPTAGELLRHGQPVTGPSKDIGYMLARSALTPWRTARRNVELGLELRKVPSSRRRTEAIELLELVRVGAFAEHYPAQLSHGMQQRVAIARTLAIDPDLWLMDEPFGALDAQTRLTLQEEFLRVWEGSGRTVLFVTHDLGEAVLMADRVVVMSARPGRIRLDRPVHLPRPRQLRELRVADEFLSIEREVYKELQNETI